MKKQKEIIVIEVDGPREFTNDYDPSDNRVGMWNAELSIHYADENGNRTRNVENTRYSWGYLHTGLRKEYNDARYAAQDMARDAVTVLRAVGKEAYYTCADKNEYSEWTLESYLREKREKAESKAMADELRKRAKELLAEAQALCA